MEKQTGILNVDQIAEMFGLVSWEKLDDYNADYIFENGEIAAKEAEKDGANMEEIEAARDKGAQEAGDELFHKWHSAVMYAAETLFKEHGLTLEPRHKHEEYPFEYKVCAEDWKVAVGKIIDTINGVGYFYFHNIKEFMESGPYSTPRQAVLHHLHWIKDRPTVYGEASAERLYESHF